MLRADSPGTAAFDAAHFVSVVRTEGPAVHGVTEPVVALDHLGTVLAVCVGQGAGLERSGERYGTADCVGIWPIAIDG